MAESAPDNADVRLFPPVVYLAGLIVGYLVDLISHVPIAPPGWSVVGAVLVAIGVWLNISASSLFDRLKTAVPPWQPATALATSGPYRYTRNPMYLGMALILGGLALVGNALWPLIAVVPVIVIIRTQVIAREERYLEAKFGHAYRDLKRRVRRWL